MTKLELILSEFSTTEGTNPCRGLWEIGKGNWGKLQLTMTWGVLWHIDSIKTAGDVDVI